MKPLKPKALLKPELKVAAVSEKHAATLLTLPERGLGAVCSPVKISAQGLLAQPSMETVQGAANHHAGQPWCAEPAPQCAPLWERSNHVSSPTCLPNLTSVFSKKQILLQPRVATASFCSKEKVISPASFSPAFSRKLIKYT